jgi:MFS superfamily sulfate permease-like transporter
MLILPRLTWADFQALVLPSVTIALISFADAIITARSFAVKHHYAIDANQELVALGWQILRLVSLAAFRSQAALRAPRS